jgi:predicted nucleotide-binding protein
VDRVGSGNLEAVVLAEQADMGMTIIEKFEHHASSAGFAVVLFTKDDLGGSKLDEKLRARARQDVVFELGYFVGVLGRNRTVLMVDDEVEIPSDIYGVLYIKLDESGAWKDQLVREMQAAGLTVDFSRIV